MRNLRGLLVAVLVASGCGGEIDGGVSVETIERCRSAGADTFVAGSAVFAADDPAAMVDKLRSLGG